MLRLLLVVLVFSAACKRDAPSSVQYGSETQAPQEAEPLPPAEPPPPAEPQRPPSPPEPQCALPAFEFATYAKTRMPDKKPKRARRWNPSLDRGVLLPGGVTAAMYIKGDRMDGFEAGVDFSKGKSVQIGNAVGFSEGSDPAPTIENMAYGDFDGDKKLDLVLHHSVEMIFPSDPPTGIHSDHYLTVISMPERKIFHQHNIGRCEKWSVSVGPCEGQSRIVYECDTTKTVYTRAAGEPRYKKVHGPLPPIVNQNKATGIVGPQGLELKNWDAHLILAPAKELEGATITMSSLSPLAPGVGPGGCRNTPMSNAISITSTKPMAGSSYSNSIEVLLRRGAESPAIRRWATPLPGSEKKAGWFTYPLGGTQKDLLHLKIHFKDLPSELKLIAVDHVCLPDDGD